MGENLFKQHAIKWGKSLAICQSDGPFPFLQGWGLRGKQQPGDSATHWSEFPRKCLWKPEGVSALLQRHRGARDRRKSSNTKVGQWWQRQIREAATEGFKPQNTPINTSWHCICVLLIRDRQHFWPSAYSHEKDKHQDICAITTISSDRKWQLFVNAAKVGWESETRLALTQTTPGATRLSYQFWNTDKCRKWFWFSGRNAPGCSHWCNVAFIYSCVYHPVSVSKCTMVLTMCCTVCLFCRWHQCSIL